MGPHVDSPCKSILSQKRTLLNPSLSRAREAAGLLALPTEHSLAGSILHSKTKYMENSRRPRDNYKLKKERAWIDLGATTGNLDTFCTVYKATVVESHVSIVGISISSPCKLPSFPRAVARTNLLISYPFKFSSLSHALSYEGTSI